MSCFVSFWPTGRSISPEEPLMNCGVLESVVHRPIITLSVLDTTVGNDEVARWDPNGGCQYWSQHVSLKLPLCKVNHSVLVHVIEQVSVH